ncbi:Signal transduction histidine kinase [Vandammella animalimorsus]|uniref:Signal transduction histidine kinase n=1 Tax=Vandammella animalimorsus TaxID=2029117 RepID=A0A2A2ASV3_9BURK|nr:Signal transduction histidine kinase [Vandammella animalimorsus]PAT40729.1 Signal transduction histidine kinase [Vandammella animalimorsus]
MNARLGLIILLALGIGLLYYFNWDALIVPTDVSLGFAVVHAPIGIILLVLMCLLGALFIAYVLWLHSTVIMDYHRYTKELKQQRELADKAEASRFTELRSFLAEQHKQGQEELLRQMEELEDHIYSRVDDSDNSTAAYIGQIENQLRHHPAPQLPLHPSPEQRDS